MVIKIVITGLLLAGCPSGNDQRKTKPTPTPSPSKTDPSRGATNDTDRQGAHGHGIAVVGGGSRSDPDPNDYVKKDTEEQDSGKTTSQHSVEQTPSQHSVEQAPDTSQSPTEKTVEQQPKEVKDTKNTESTDSSTTSERQPSPMVSLSFVEQEGHLMPILELKDATAVTDVEIYRKAHDFAINSDGFDNKVTGIPRQTYYVKLKVQGRQCNNEVEIDDMTQAKTFRMNCR